MHPIIAALKHHRTAVVLVLLEVALTCAIVTNALFVIGTQTVLNNLVAVSYPTEIRSTAVGLYLGIARVGAMCGPAIAGVLQQLTGGAGTLFFVLGAALVTAAVLVFLVARPERLPKAPAFGH